MKKVLIPIIIILCLLSGGYFLWTNLEEDIFYSPEFPSNTYINGIECSGMTASEVQEKLTEEWNKNYVTIKSEDTILGSIRLTGVSYDINDQLRNLRKEYFVDTAMNQLFGSPLNMTVTMTLDETGTAFDTALKNADYLNEENVKETQDAYIDLNDHELPIIEEVYGNNVDYDALVGEIFKLVGNEIFSFQYVSSEFYEEPEIKSDDEALLERQAFYKENIVCNVSYLMGEDKITISPSQLADFRNITLKKNGELTDDEIKEIKSALSDNIINEDEVREYVFQFAREYNTLGSTRKFKTSKGKTVNVEGGDYGWALDQEAETAQLIEDVKSGKTINREPLWLMTGFTDYRIGNDIGNTYVEISIKKQHLWYYKDGKKIVDCDVVTGNPYMGYSTPTGTYSLSYKQLGATLRGEEADGSEYESPVTYWMPFFGNYGMHDATWRYSFGGEIYLGGGSHGCVNMPYESAEKLFENLADRNVPIIVYDK